MFTFFIGNWLYRQQERIQVIPKKTNKILHFRIILSNKNSVRKLIAFKVDNVQGFRVFPFTPLCEHTRKRHGEHSRAPREDGPEDTLQARVHSATAHVLHSWLSLLLLAFVLSPPPPSQILFHRFPHKGDFRSNNENLGFPQECP